MNQQTGASLIKYVSYGLFFTSAVWASIAFPPIAFIGRMYVDVLHWPMGNGLPEFNQNLAWLSAVGAGLLAALGVVNLRIVYPAVLSGNRGTMNTMVLAVVVWFLIDSAGSIAAGVGFNAVVNAILMVPLVGPLLLTKIER